MDNKITGSDKHPPKGVDCMVKTKTVYWIPNFEKEYADSEDAKTMNMMEYGIKRLGQAAKQRKRGLITKREYTLYRNEIEKQLFRF